MKIGVFGNCQAEGLAVSIRAWAPEAEVVVKSAVGLRLDDEATLSTMRRDLLACDHVLMQTLEARRPQFQPFIDNLLGAADGRALRWPIVIFNGFHPDSVYVTREGALIDGPLDQYHSALAVAAWQEGLGPVRALALFNAYTYACIGYFDAYAIGLDYFRSPALVGYDLTCGISPTRPFMHTINHPKIEISVEIARQALDRLGLARRSEIDTPADPLASGAVWPLYPEIAERLGIPSASETTDLAAIVAAEYRLLNIAQGANREALDVGGPVGASAIARARAFIRAEVI